MRLDAEDLINSLLVTHLRLIDPDIVLRDIINTALGYDAIGKDELGHGYVKYHPWALLDPPRERSPQGRQSYLGAFPALRASTAGPKEGVSEADLLLELGNLKTKVRCDTLVVFELKLRSSLSKSTAHDSQRDQATRGFDVLWNRASRLGITKFYFILLDNQRAPDPLIVRMKSPAFLRQQFGARGGDHEFYGSMAKRIGWIPYDTVRSIIIQCLPRIKSHAEYQAAEDLTFLLNEVVQSSVVQQSFDLV